MDKNYLNYRALVFIALVCVAAIGGMVVYRLSADQNRLSSQKTMLEAQEKRLAVLQADNAALTEKLNAKPAISCLSPLPPPPPVEEPAKNEVQAVLEPPPQQVDDYQTKIDTLKKRYEDVLVTYFVLRKCERVNATDYHIVTSALSQEMASLNAPGRLQYDILTSAQGSYNELYSGNSCDAYTLEPLQAKYKTFIDSVAAEFIPH